MSMSQTELKGTVVFNSDAGANLTIGNSTGTNAITGTTNINISGGSVTTIGNISANGIINLNSPDINIGTTTSFVNIGTLTGTGQNRLNKPLTPLYAYPVISTTIGYRVLDPILQVSLNTNGFTELTNALILPLGVWLINYTIRINPAGTSVLNNLTLWGEESLNPTERYAQNGLITGVTTSQQILYTGSFTLIGTASNSYKLKVYSVYSGNTLSTVITPTSDYSTIIRTRIA